MSAAQRSRGAQGTHPGRRSDRFDRIGPSGRTASVSRAGSAHWPRQLAARLWSALWQTGATVALQHGITMMTPPTLTDSSAHRAGETA